MCALAIEAHRRPGATQTTCEDLCDGAWDGRVRGCRPSLDDLYPVTRLDLEHADSMRPTVQKDAFAAPCHFCGSAG
jgi:hypothetical protein